MEHFDTIGRYLTAAGKRDLFNGAWLLMRDDHIVSAGAVGSRHPKYDLPIDTGTLFDIASVSKQFTATAIILLRDRSLLNLQDTLKKYYPETSYHCVTVYQLLTHTSGLPDCFKWSLDYQKAHGQCTGGEVIDGLITSSRLPLQFLPGQEYCYCNTAFCVLARIVEKVSGIPFSDFLLENIFIPSGMTRTRIDHSMTKKSLMENYAFGTVVEDGVVLPVEESKNEAYTVDLPWMDGDGSVVTSVEDLLLWDKALREETVLSKASQEEMFRGCTLPDGRRTNYGFGWCLSEGARGQRVVSHTGRWAGYLSYFGRLPDENAALAVLCNRYGADINAWIEMEDAFQAFLCGETQIPAPEILNAKAVWTENAKERLRALYGEYVLSTEPIKGLFDARLCIEEENGVAKIFLTFMDTVFHSDLVLLKNGHFMERRGLFDFTAENEEFVTYMYNKRFTFKRK